jgi:hypothetical protein
LGQGLVLAFSQDAVSVPSRTRCSHSRSISHVAGLCCTSQHAKQNFCPHLQSTCAAQGSWKVH